MARKRQRNSSQSELLYDSTEQQKQQIESMSMPQPPQNWPQNERDESHDTKNLPDSEQQKQQIGSMSMPQLPENWPQNERDESHDTKNLPEGTRLSSKLGVLARNGILAPLNHKDWRLVPSMYKDRIWAHIKENTDATDDMKRILMMSFGSKWKESKHEAITIGYDLYNTDIERLAHCPDRVEEDQCRSLVHYWSSKEAKEKSESNKESQKKLTMPHTSGRKSHSQIIDDMTKMNNAVKPTRIEVFKKTHIRANKEPVNEIAGEVMKQMDDLAEVYPELNVPGSAPNDVYSQVMGSDTHGIVRTLGKGASPSLVYGPVYKRSQTEKRDFDTRVEMEVPKATSAMKIEMTEKMYEAKKEMEAMDKNLLEVKEEAKENNEVMERKLSEAKMDMEEIIVDKVKEGIQAYVESLGINIDANLKSEQVPDNPLKDCQQPSSLVPGVHTRKLV
ncbi:hypothetical protein KY290_011030 [Solanum tuberosum]|uniref:Integrase core domain containing protein n=1 Tax=Solanum tuberosum TaxID=4113 RepID=A0ABQ7W1F3_SOLTU|nr:hypothetical protein KY289_013689 [Solanum tuberosum]KAH0717009.1 hypothetical protein KY285_013040 [Solanum tuberosum]KAH0769585.1 hypothetical protein KY290_013566 [Solanum tuberosum]KAH0773893.1 hypothetical protein KY290_011030 [Solanum tuberosum]